MIKASQSDHFIIANLTERKLLQNGQNRSKRIT